MTVVVDAFPLARMQGGMLFHTELSPADQLYHNIDSLRVTAPLVVERLDRAAQALARRHPVLRTSFDLAGYAEPLQMVHREEHVPLRVIDLRGLAEAEQEAAFDGWMEEERQHNFTWSSPPLLRLTAHRLSDAEFRLSITYHHAILDGWSINTLLSELLTHYWALLEDEAAAEPPVPSTSFAEFIALERAAIASEAARSFWLRQLEGASLTRLPRWPGREPRRGEKVPNRERELPPDLSARLLELAAGMGVPVKSVLLAAHVKVLQVLSGSADVTTGLVSNGRPDSPDADRVLGLFLNTVPLRLLTPRGSWRDLVVLAFATERGLLPYRHYPLLDLQQACGGRTLFETSFNFVHFRVLEEVNQLRGLELGGWRHFQQTSIPFAVTFAVDSWSSAPGHKPLRMLAAWDADEFDRRQVSTIEEGYQIALEAIAADADASHDACDLMGPDERRQVLVEWNQTAREYPVERVHVLFERQVAARPEAQALSFEGVGVTYRELNRRANRLARRLRGLGVGLEDRVAIAAGRSVETIAGILAVLKAGGTYVPIDLGNPRRRIEFLLRDARAAAVLTQREVAGDLPLGGIPTIHLDDDEAPGPGDDDNLDVAVPPHSAAYVLYTSGSTGVPKGAVIEHHSVCNFTNSTRRMFEVDHRDRVLQFASLGFDVSVFEIFTALHSGATLCLARQETLLELDDLGELMRRERISIIDMPPAVMALLPAASFPHLRILFVGGEAFSADLVNRWALPGRRFFNGYGTTESTVTMTAMECAGWHEAPPSIGKPMANHRVYVLDTGLRPVPVGVPGELCLAGVGIARCYLDRPALTAERFVPDPFSGVPGARMYRSGDLAAFRPDGNVDFLGRLDDQVKIRGVRVELGETLSALEAHPAVRQATVQLDDGAVGGKRLVAYVVADGIAAEELRTHLAERLPAHAIPERIIFIGSLPLTPSGKVDRDALPAPGDARADAEVAFVAPRSSVEEVLCDLWADVLGVPQIGVNDPFFQLGGNSLLATQLVARVRETFGVRFELRWLFEQPTVAGMAEHLLRDAEWRPRVERVAEGLLRMSGEAMDELL